jgi:hypothetical protein
MVKQLEKPKYSYQASYKGLPTERWDYIGTMQGYKREEEWVIPPEDLFTGDKSGNTISRSTLELILKTNDNK